MECGLCELTKPLDKKCVQCDLPLCAECVRGHRKILTEHVIEECITQSELVTLLSDVKSSLLQIPDHIKELEDNQTALGTIQKDGEAKVEECREKQLCQVNSHHDDLLQTIRDQSAAFKQKLSKNTQDAKQLLKALESHEYQLENLRKAGKQEDLLVKGYNSVKTAKLDLKSLKDLKSTNATKLKICVHEPKSFTSTRVIISKLTHSGSSFILQTVSDFTLLSEISWPSGLCVAKRIQYSSSNLWDIKRVGAELWCTTQSGLMVYDWDGELIKTVQFHYKGSTSSVSYPSANGSDILILDWIHGVYLLNPSGQFIKYLCLGAYCDITEFNGMMYALANERGTVTVLEDGDEGWEVTKEIQLSGYTKSDFWDRICVTQDRIYRSSNCNHSLYLYDMEGKLLSNAGEYGDGVTPGGLYYPLLSGMDHMGTSLVVDWWNNSLQMFKTDTEDWLPVLKLPDEVTYPGHVAWNESDRSMWISAGGGNGFNAVYKLTY